jgi:hypothetical protein
LRRGKLKDQDRITETLDLADELIEKTGGEVMMPLIFMRRAELAELMGDKAGHLRLLKKAHDLYTSMGAHGYAEQLAAKLTLSEKVMSAKD